MRIPCICLNCRLKGRANWSFRRSFTNSPAVCNDGPRPTTAPKPTPNVRHIRDNAALYSKNCVDRNYKSLADHPAKIQKLSEEAAQLQEALKAPKSKMKQVEMSIARLATSAATAGPGQHDELTGLRVQAQQLKDQTQEVVVRRARCMDMIQHLALSLPNLTDPETPIGDDPKVVGYINYDPRCPPSYVHAPGSYRSHVDIGTTLGLLDFTSSATSTGWGWYYLTNEGALLEQALIQHALSVAVRRGWKAVSPPSIVYSHIAEACGFQPRDHHGEQQIWLIEQSEKDRNKPQRCLAGTAEIPLAAMHAGRDIEPERLPIRLVGASRCYRAEAGARGVDTKGLYRVHEFTKVELFAWTDNLPSPSTPALTLSSISGSSVPSPSLESDGTSLLPGNDRPSSTTIFAEILSIQREILTSLNLPCRILEMPSYDLGASATRKRDIEVLFPSRLGKPRGRADSPWEASDVAGNGWGEVTSASICTDYQSRRLGTRVRGGSPARYPHTANGTAIAVPRVLAAILENGWDEARREVVVPEALRGWMGGLEVLGRGS